MDQSFAYKATAGWTHTQTHLPHIITMSFSERFSKGFQKILEQSMSLWSSLKACYMQSSNLSFSSRWDETYFNIYLWPRGCYTLLFLWLAETISELFLFVYFNFISFFWMLHQFVFPFVCSLPSIFIPPSLSALVICCSFVRLSFSHPTLYPFLSLCVFVRLPAFSHYHFFFLIFLTWHMAFF